ncbi:MAG: hypothetical protein AAB870_04820 [Patescibacteria group bacterium]
MLQSDIFTLIFVYVPFINITLMVAIGIACVALRSRTGGMVKSIWSMVAVLPFVFALRETTLTLQAYGIVNFYRYDDLIVFCVLIYIILTARRLNKFFY